MNTGAPALSAVIIARDAEETIARALRSVAFTDERIVVVDDRTQDDTAAVAAREGARVHTKSWSGYGPQKNVGAELATHPWLLFIDADEEVPPELRTAIEKTIHNTTFTIFWIRITTVFLGKKLSHLYGHNPRLFRKDAARWTNAQVHEQVIRLDGHAQPDGESVKLADSDTGLITAPILHHSHATIQSYLAKMHRYTTLDAQQMARSGTHRSGAPARDVWWYPWFIATKQLVKLLFYKKGILDGYAGLMWSALSAYYELEMGWKWRRVSSNSSQ